MYEFISLHQTIELTAIFTKSAPISIVALHETAANRNCREPRPLHSKALFYTEPLNGVAGKLRFLFYKTLHEKLDLLVFANVANI